MFVLISLGLHAVLLTCAKPASLHFPGQTHAVLSVSLGKSEPAAAQRAKRAAPITSRRAASGQPPRNSETAVPRHEARREPALVAAPAPSASNDTVAAGDAWAPTTATSPDPPVPAPDGTTANAAEGQGEPSAHARVRTLLLADIKRYFEYPALARRRGWEGRVWLSVTVEPDGALDRIRVTRSSGYEVLDRSALAALQRVGALADAKRWSGKEAFEFSLPIIYRLTD